jgi:hypothetical protein
MGSKPKPDREWLFGRMVDGIELRGNIAGYVSNDFDIEIRALHLFQCKKKGSVVIPINSLTKMSVGKSGQIRIVHRGFGENSHRQLRRLSVWRNKTVAV